jgi:hypothetical protein
MKKICKHHGMTEFVLEGRGYHRCKKCRSVNVQKRRIKLKIMAVEYKGKKCSCCGYDKCINALEFHHVDGTKEFGIAHKGYTRSWKLIQKELDKCILVCANCHREIHSQ